MLTAAGTLDHRLSRFGLGADDYLAKPFELPELIARVTALSRRSSPQRNTVLVCGDVRLDETRKRVMRGDAEIPLSPKEFAVLQVLMEAGGAAPPDSPGPATGWASRLSTQSPPPSTASSTSSLKRAAA